MSEVKVQIDQEVLILPCVGQELTPGRKLQTEEFVVTRKTTKKDLRTWLQLYNLPVSGARPVLLKTLRDFSGNRNAWLRYVVSNSITAQDVPTWVYSTVYFNHGRKDGASIQCGNHSPQNGLQHSLVRRIIQSRTKARRVQVMSSEVWKTTIGLRTAIG